METKQLWDNTPPQSLTRKTANTTCGEGCRYRGLYEGTQATLSDLASKQAATLAKHGKLRRSLIDLFRKNLPREVSVLEAKTGSKLSDATDDELVSYIQFLLIEEIENSTGNTKETDVGIEQLRQAIENLGVVLDDSNNFGVWADQLRRHSQQQAPKPEPKPVFSPEPRRGGSQPIFTSVGVLWAKPWPGFEPKTSLADLVARTNPTPQGSETNPANAGFVEPTPTIQPTNNTNSKVAASAGMDITNPVSPLVKGNTYPLPMGVAPTTRTKPDTATAAGMSRVNKAVTVEPSTSEPLESLETIFEIVPTKQPSNDGVETKTHKVSVTTTTDNTSPSDANTSETDQESESPLPNTSEDDNNLDVLLAEPENPFDDEFGLENNPFENDVFTGELPEVFNTEFGEHLEDPIDSEFPPLDDLNSDTTAVSSVEQTNLHTTTDEVSQDETGGKATQTSELVTADKTSGEATEEQTIDTRKQVVSQPLKPQLLVSQPKSKKAGTPAKRKTSRVNAITPENNMFDVPPTNLATLTELTDEARNRLNAAISVARPMFVSDLVEVVGNPDLVEAYLDEARKNLGNSTVRFVAPKGRHKARGELVLPYGELRAANENRLAKTWWGECIRLYRGAVSYEMGVLLHRVADDLVSHRFTSETALLRLSTHRGIIGIVVATGNKIGPGEATRNELIEVIGELLTERLELLVVLTVSDPASKVLLPALGEIAVEQHWKPNMTVVGGRSWDYENPSGVALTHLFG